MAFAPAAPLKWGNAELQPATDFTAASVPIYRHSSRRRPRPRPIVVTARLTRRAFLSQALVVALAPLLRRPARAEYNAEPDGLETDLYSQSSARGGATGLGLRPPISGDDHVRPQSQKSRIPSEVPDPRVRMQIFERQATRHYAIDSENDEEQGQAESSHGTVRVRVTKERDKLSERNAESDKRAYEDLRAYDTVEGLNDADEDGPVPIDYVDAVTIRRDELLSDSFAEFLKSSAATAGVFVTVASLIALAERNSISRRDAIPLQYDRKRIARYCLTRPERVIMRISKYAIEIMRYASIVAVDAFLDGIRAGGRAAKRARRKRRARNLRECITRLGPGLIKLGQAAATRPDLFGETFTSELQLLQDSLFQGFQSKEAFELIRDELQAPLKSIFAYIEPKPVAGASLGMVFKAWLVEKAKDESSVESVANEQVVPSSELEVDRLSIGNVNISAETTSAEKREQSDSAYMPRVRFQQERNKVFQWRWKRPPELFLKTRQEVAIKVQRPHVAELMTLDFFIVRGIAVVIARILNIRTDLGDAVDEYASSVFEELNYIKEADNMQRFREMYGATPGLYIPEVYPVYSSRRVLVVEWIDGIRLTDKRARVRAQDIGIVEIGIRSALDQCLSGGFMHCDLHNGNILRLKQDLTKLAFIDFGICASIPEYTRQCTVCALLHLIHHDYAALADTFAGMSLMRAVDLEKELPLLSEALGKALESGRDEKTVDDEANRQARGPAVKLSGPVVAEQSSTKAFVKEDIAMQQNAPIFSRDDANLKENQVSQPASDDSAESHSSDSMYSELDNEFVEDVYENLPAVSKFTFIGVAEKLIRLSGQFPLVFRDYFLSNIKSLAMLEGLAVNADPEFNVLTIVYPYVVSKVLSDPATQFRAALHDLVVDRHGRVRMELLERMVRLSKTCSMFMSRSKIRAGYSCSRSQSAREVLEFVSSRNGRFVLRMALRQYIADGCLLTCTWLDQLFYGKAAAAEINKKCGAAHARAKANFRTWKTLYKNLEVPTPASVLALIRLGPALAWWNMAVGFRGILHLSLLAFSVILDLVAMPFRFTFRVVIQSITGFVSRTLDTPVDFDYGPGRDQ